MNENQKRVVTPEEKEAIRSALALCEAMIALLAENSTMQEPYASIILGGMGAISSRNIRALQGLIEA